MSEPTRQKHVSAATAILIWLASVLTRLAVVVVVAHSVLSYFVVGTTQVLTRHEPSEQPSHTLTEQDGSVRILNNPDKIPVTARLVEFRELPKVGTFHVDTRPSDPLFNSGAYESSCRALVVEWNTKDKETFALDYRFPALSGEKCHPGGLRGEDGYYPVPALAFNRMNFRDFPIVCVIEGGGVVREGFVQAGGVLILMWPVPTASSRVTLNLPGRKPVQMQLK